MPTLGQKLKYFRKRADLSQFDLENLANLSTGTISRIEGNTINPTKETILKIADILNLNDLQISYLIGRLSKPASDKEIKEAQEAVKNYFNKKSTLAYMTCDRSRLIDMSKGFRLLTNIDDNKWKKLQGELFPLMLLEDSFGLKQFLDNDKMDKILENAFERTYTEMGHMTYDPYLNRIENELEKHPKINKYWQSLKNGNIPVRTMDKRTVYFNYKGKKIEMKYHSEILPSNPRFIILDYKPTNYLVRILSTIL